jgi:phospholipid/cholesterol/gamma-HCH transport system permease protein
MSPVPEPSPASISVQSAGASLEVSVAGDWRLTAATPSWERSRAGLRPAPVRLRTEDIGSWDSSLLLFLSDVGAWCRANGVECDGSALPEKMRALVAQLDSARAPRPQADHRESLLTSVGLAAREAVGNLGAILHFVGECILGAAHLARRPAKFRWRDCLDQMQQCGAMAVPIVSLISVLVGLTLAYQAAVELRQFGADIYVADLVGLSVVREMGPMMVAVILAGRTGAAFAATLGNMRANEEIDALQTLGISPVEFLVLPRILALGLMMPLLALYADAVGALGGMVAASGILHIPPSAYWIEMQTSLEVHDINTGLIKALVFGLLIGLSGCLCGMRADRSAEGVGRAATLAVVTAILFIVVADAAAAVVYNLLGV